LGFPQRLIDKIKLKLIEADNASLMRDIPLLRTGKTMEDMGDIKTLKHGSTMENMGDVKDNRQLTLIDIQKEREIVEKDAAIN